MLSSIGMPIVSYAMKLLTKRQTFSSIVAQGGTPFLLDLLPILHPLCNLQIFPHMGTKKEHKNTLQVKYNFMLNHILNSSFTLAGCHSCRNLSFFIFVLHFFLNSGFALAGRHPYVSLSFFVFVLYSILNSSFALAGRCSCMNSRPMLFYEILYSI